MSQASHLVDYEEYGAADQEAAYTILELGGGIQQCASQAPAFAPNTFLCHPEWPSESPADFLPYAIDPMLADVSNVPYHAEPWASQYPYAAFGDDGEQFGGDRGPSNNSLSSTSIHPNTQTNDPPKSFTPDPRSIECSKCAKTFSRTYDLSRHMRTHEHNAMPSYSCPIKGCSRVNEFGFFRKDKLSAHIQTVHGDDNQKGDGDPDSKEEEVSSSPQLKTGYAAQSQYLRSSVAQHIEDTYMVGDRSGHALRHVSRKQPSFPCPHPGCGKTFIRMVDLRRHRKVHLNNDERPYQCSVCKKGFLYPKDHARHMKTHESDHSVPRYRCSEKECLRNELSEAFTNLDDLKRHIALIHPGTNAYAITSSIMFTCIHCSMQFSRKDNLLRHIRKHHVREAANSAILDDSVKLVEPVMEKAKHAAAATEEDDEAYGKGLNNTGIMLSQRYDDIDIDDVKSIQIANFFI